MVNLKSYFPFLYSLFLIYILTKEVDQASFGIEINDKLVHLIIYFIFFFAWINIFESYFKNNSLVKLYFFSIIFSSTIEFFQNYLTITRKFEIMDIIFNITGISLAFLIIIIKKSVIKKL